MTERKENELLRDIFLDAVTEEFSSELSSTARVETSPKFQKSMRTMLENPNKWAKRRQRPIWKRAISTAAAIILVCILSLGVLMMVSPKAYAAVINWVTHLYENGIVYNFGDDAKSDSISSYVLSVLPDGYSFDSQILCAPDEFSDATELSYPNKTTNQIIIFRYFPMSSSTALSVSTDGIIVSDITVKDCPGKLYISTDPNRSSTIIWIDESSNICFSIEGIISQEDIIAAANGVVPSWEK